MSSTVESIPSDRYLLVVSYDIYLVREMWHGQRCMKKRWDDRNSQTTKSILFKVPNVKCFTRKCVLYKIMIMAYNNKLPVLPFFDSTKFRNLVHLENFVSVLRTQVK